MKRCSRPEPQRGAQDGVTLVEVIMAITIFSVVLVTLGGLMFSVARQAQNSATATFRSGAVTRAAAWIDVLPWTDLPGSVGCTSDSTGLLAYDQCVSVQDSTPRLRRVTVVITPTGVLTARPETLVVYRHRARPDSPLR